MSDPTSALATHEDEFDLDLDAARSAASEAHQHKPAIKVGGQRIELPEELPLDVLQPLLHLDVDLSILLRQALDARRAGSNDDAISAVVDMLVMNKSLPQDIVTAATTMARRLVGDEGYERLVAARLTLPEIGRLAKYLGRRYGVGLGEASPSSGSSEGTGTTSSPTSSPGITSTSEGSGSAPESRAS